MVAKEENVRFIDRSWKRSCRQIVSLCNFMALIWVSMEGCVPEIKARFKTPLQAERTRLNCSTAGQPPSSRKRFRTFFWKKMAGLDLKGSRIDGGGIGRALSAIMRVSYKKGSILCGITSLGKYGERQDLPHTNAMSHSWKSCSHLWIFSHRELNDLPLQFRRK
jgi:hypothetical protein